MRSEEIAACGGISQLEVVYLSLFVGGFVLIVN